MKKIVKEMRLTEKVVKDIIRVAYQGKIQFQYYTGEYYEFRDGFGYDPKLIGATISKSGITTTISNKEISSLINKVHPFKSLVFDLFVKTNTSYDCIGREEGRAVKVVFSGAVLKL